MKKTILILILLVFSQKAFSQKNWSAILSNSDIVLLGEQAHGVQSFYEEKQKIIKQIELVSQQELLLLIESPLVLSAIRELESRKSNYHSSYKH